MIRFLIFLLLIVGLSSALYMVFSDLGNIEIYFSDYYVVVSAGIFCVFTLLACFLVVGMMGMFWWIKNLPKTLMRLRVEHTYQKAVNEAFDLVCALESSNKELAIRLNQRNNWSLIRHPIINYFSWKVAYLNKNATEADIEKFLLSMYEDEKTCVPAIEELVKNKIKAAEFELANQYLTKLDKLPYKPRWYYNTKITVSLAVHNWEEAVSVLEKADKLKIFSNSELKSLFSLTYYLKAKWYFNQSLPDDAIAILKKSVNSNNMHIESVLLLTELLGTRDKTKDATGCLIKCWQSCPDYRLITSMLEMNAELSVTKKFEELEKLGVVNNQAGLLLAHAALSLNLLSKARKYIDLSKKEGGDYSKKLECLYKLLAEEDKIHVHALLDRFLL